MCFTFSLVVNISGKWSDISAYGIHEIILERWQFVIIINQSINQSLTTKGPSGHLQCYADNR